MFWVKFKRVLKGGWMNFKRNGLVSYAAILVTTITLCVVTGLFLFQAVLGNAIQNVQEKVDIAVYFKVDASEDDILALKNTLEQLPEVANVEYSSADEEVLNFRERHANDYLTLQALDELGDNPFGGTLRIKAKDSMQYESIARVLEGDSQIARDNSSIIERINYSQNKLIIDRLNGLISNMHRIGYAVTIVLALISIIIMYTMIRLTIYISREEIGIMRLVGASGQYVRAPFLWEGMLYGAFAWLLSVIIFLPLTYVVGARASEVIGMDVYQYYLGHFFSIGGLVLLIGLFLGFVSSYLAVRRYLNV